jgi:hypothetical protein
MLRDALGLIFSPWTLILILVTGLPIVFWTTARRAPRKGEPILFGLSHEVGSRDETLKKLRQNTWEEFGEQTMRVVFICIVLAGLVLLAWLLSRDVAQLGMYLLISACFSLIAFIFTEVGVGLDLYARYRSAIRFVIKSRLLSY